MNSKVLEKNKKVAAKLGANTSGASEVHIVHGKGKRTAVWADGTTLHALSKENKIVGGKTSRQSIPVDRIVSVSSQDVKGGQARVMVTGEGAMWSVTGDRFNLGAVEHMLRRLATANSLRGEAGQG